MEEKQHKAMTMQQIIASRLAPINAGAMNYTTVPSSAAESARNWKIQGFLGRKNFKGNDITRVILPHDEKGSQAARDLEYRRQSVMPWGSVFMANMPDVRRLDNVAQIAAVQQRQLVPPNTYGQFYAFMHALSAAFGNLQNNG